MVFGVGFNYYSGRWAEVPSERNLQDGHGFGVDIGLKYKFLPNLFLSFSAKNLFAKMWWDEKGEKLPLFLSSGANYRVSDFVILNFDVEERKYYKDTGSGKNFVIKHFGIEHNIFGRVFLRLGAYGEEIGGEDTTYTAGIGYKKENVSLSIAWQTFKKDKKYEELIFTINTPFTSP